MFVHWIIGANDHRQESPQRAPPCTDSQLLNQQFNSTTYVYKPPPLTSKPKPTLPKSHIFSAPSTPSKSLKSLSCGDATAHSQLYFPLSRHLPSWRISPILSTRPALLTNTIQIWYKYSSNTTQIQIHCSTPHERSPYDCPVLLQLPAASSAFYPKITHRQPLLIPTCDPYLWPPLYLNLLLLSQIQIQKQCWLSPPLSEVTNADLRKIYILTS